MSGNWTRRLFLSVVSSGAAVFGPPRSRAAETPLPAFPAAPAVVKKTGSDRPALLGGEPVRQAPFPSWPVIGDNDRLAIRDVLESREWFRFSGHRVSDFEEAWRDRLGARYVLATASGTSALYTSLYALGIGPGDEVIVPPYTFVATVNVVLLHHALPVFVDSDRETMQIDARKIEAAVSEKTRCILPVHLGGNVADLDTILEVSARRDIPVLEDACQAHLAEWRGRKAGTLGRLGCFSFQESKNLNSGEGGAIAGNDGELMTICNSFHNAGRPYDLDEAGQVRPARDSSFSYIRNGDNRRLTEFQGALLLQQLTRLEEQSQRRDENAAYLSGLLSQIAGIHPARQYEGCTRNAYHIYMLRYDPPAFAELSRDRFLRALRAEGIPCSGGYSPLNREPFLKNALESRAFRRIYSERELSQLRERNVCPENDRLCQEAVWFGQTQLLGPRKDMEDIAAAILKIQSRASELVQANLI